MRYMKFWRFNLTNKIHSNDQLREILQKNGQVLLKVRVASLSESSMYVTHIPFFGKTTETDDSTVVQ